MKRSSVIYKSILVGFALFGLILQFARSTSFLQTFSYYTVQSNLWVLIFFTIILMFEFRKVPWNHPFTMMVKYMLSIGIFVTFLIYHFLLRPTLGEGSSQFTVGGLNDLLVHYVVPLMTMLDYFLFDQKGKMKWFQAPFNLIQPIDYVFYIWFYALLGGRFVFGDSVSQVPYFFLDTNRFGFDGVLIWSLLIALLYVVLGFLLYFIDGLILYFQIRQNERRG